MTYNMGYVALLLCLRYAHVLQRALKEIYDFDNWAQPTHLAEGLGSIMQIAYVTRRLM